MDLIVWDFFICRSTSCVWFNYNSISCSSMKHSQSLSTSGGLQVKDTVLTWCVWRMVSPHAHWRSPLWLSLSNVGQILEVVNLNKILDNIQVRGKYFLLFAQSVFTFSDCLYVEVLERFLPLCTVCWIRWSIMLNLKQSHLSNPSWRNVIDFAFLITGLIFYDLE